MTWSWRQELGGWNVRLDGQFAFRQLEISLSLWTWPLRPREGSELGTSLLAAACLTVKESYRRRDSVS